ncbi:MAG: hypothetical protein AB1630_10645 [bacterium]
MNEFIIAFGKGIATILLAICMLIFLVWFLVWFLFKVSKDEEKKASFLTILLYGIIGAFAGISWQAIIGPLLRVPTNISIWIVLMVTGFILGFISRIPNKSFVKIKKLFIFLFISIPIVCPFIYPSLYDSILIDQAREKCTKKNLNNIRLTIVSYYEKNGKYPIELYGFSIFTQDFPRALLPRNIAHPDSNKVLIIHTKPNQKIQPSQITDEGGWIYSSNSGDIRINCSHKDSKGVYYYKW